MSRQVTIVAGVIVAAILVLTGYNFVRDPLAEDRLVLAQRLDEARHVPEAVAASEVSTNHQRTILGKPGVFRELVAPPPAPPPPPPPPPPKPELQKMLKGVQPTRMQIGERIQIKTPQHPRGEFFAVGDELQGVKIAAFDRESVTFSYFWKNGNEELTYTMPRK